MMHLVLLTVLILPWLVKDMNSVLQASFLRKSSHTFLRLWIIQKGEIVEVQYSDKGLTLSETPVQYA